MFLLDGLLEDTCRVHPKPSVAPVEAAGREDSLVAAEAWTAYLARNSSPVVDIFGMQIKSRVTCNECTHESLTFDPALSISVSIPAAPRGLTGFVLKTSELPSITDHSSYASATSISFHSLKGLNGRRLRARDVAHYFLDHSSRDAAARAPAFASEAAPGPRPDGRVVAVGLCLYHKNSYATIIIESDQIVSDAMAAFLELCSESTRYVDRSFCHPVVWFLPSHSGAAKASKRARSGEALGAIETDGDVNDACAGASSVVLVQCVWCCEYARSTASVGDPLAIAIPAGSDGRAVAAAVREELVSLGYELSALGLRYLRRDQQYLKAALRFEENLPDSFCKLPLVSDALLSLRDLCAGAVMIYAPVSKNPLSDNRPSMWPSLSKPLRREPREPVALEACLAAEFGTREQLSAANSWFCPKCRKDVRAFKQIDLWRAPRSLTIHLKRFKRSDNDASWSSEKDETPIVYPDRGLDLTPWVHGFMGDSLLYDLFAVSEHMGGVGGGHYTARVLDPLLHAWVKADDSSVRPLYAGDSPQSDDAYVLFYQRRE
jgi:hypothetical protein